MMSDAITPEHVPAPYLRLKSFPVDTKVDDDAASKCSNRARCGLARRSSTSLDPVSTTMSNFCCGVPIPTEIIYWIDPSICMGNRPRREPPSAGVVVMYWRLICNCITPCAKQHNTNRANHIAQTKVTQAEITAENKRPEKQGTDNISPTT